MHAKIEPSRSPVDDRPYIIAQSLNLYENRGCMKLVRASAYTILMALIIPSHAAEAEWTIGPFVRPAGVNPVIAPNRDSVFTCPVRREAVHWEALHTFNPAAVVRNGKICIIYRAEDDTGEMIVGGHTSRLGLAESEDGLHFSRRPAPVFYPANDAEKPREWPGGCEDPRIVETDDGTYVMTYTQWNRRATDAAIATSKDLLHWTKHGPAFARASNPAYANLSHKSAGIVCRLRGDRLVAAKIHGKFWMYWGEGEVHLATSEDAMDWRPVEDAKGNPITVLGRRPGHFDSAFPEVGPPPVLTERGILVLYNGKNDPVNGDKALAPETYAAGQALFAADSPARLIARLEEPFFKPEMPFEKTGQYSAGTTFIEGLVFFKGKWFLYYGCADSLVGVAVYSISGN